MPLPEVVMVSCADSPIEICEGSMVASTDGAAALTTLDVKTQTAIEASIPFR